MTVQLPKTGKKIEFCILGFFFCFVFRKENTGHLFDRNEHFKYISQPLTELLHSRQQQENKRSSNTHSV